MTDGVFVAGTCQGPKDIPASVAQGAAAAARVQGMITKGKVMIEPIVATIDEEACSGCRICNNLCPYNAIEFDEEKEVSRVITALCKGCGTCVAACPAQVISGPTSATNRSSPRSKAPCGMRCKPTSAGRSRSRRRSRLDDGPVARKDSYQ